MRRTLSWLLNPPVDGPPATLLIRLMAGGVFFWEGLLKLSTPTRASVVSPSSGSPRPRGPGHLVGGLEIVGGLLLLLGLATRLVAIPFMIEMVVATLTTKIGLYLGTSPSPSRRRRLRWVSGRSCTRSARNMRSFSAWFSCCLPARGGGRSTRTLSAAVR